MRTLFAGTGAFLLILWMTGCRKDLDFGPSMGNLRFSKDTVFLDTVFSNIGSGTYVLKVYNPDKDDIRIPFIGLEGGEDSGYRLNVDGEAGKSFTDIPLLAGDSLYIFIETTFDSSSLDVVSYLYTDAILFDQGPYEQKVPLVTLVKDAIFLYPSRDASGNREMLVLGTDQQGNDIEVPGFVLDTNQLVFGNEKPYVIYGYAGVPPDGTLRIEAGARLYFHGNSGLFVGNGAVLQVAGQLSDDPEALENEVVFEGDRLGQHYDNIPGQWGGVWLEAGGIQHTIEYLTIRNAKRAVYLEGGQAAPSPALSIRNSRIFNSSRENMLLKNTRIAASNLVLGNSGHISLDCEGAGNYTFRHCTLANFWSQGARGGPALRLVNATPGGGQQLTTFTSCIIYGNYPRELAIQGAATSLRYIFSHSLIRYEGAEGSAIDFDDPDNFIQCLLNAEPGFIRPSRQDFRIDGNSELSGMADPDTALLVPFDLRGIDRSTNPDIGAYQAIISN